MDARMTAYIALEHAFRAGDVSVVAEDVDGVDGCTGTPYLALAISWAPLKGAVAAGHDRCGEVLRGHR